MKQLRADLKNKLPASLWGVARNSWLGLRHLALWPGAMLHPKRRRSIKKLSALKDIHKGQRAFILGNGPSLAKTNISFLGGPGVIADCKLKGPITPG